MKNIGVKVLKVMQAVSTIAKDGFNAFHKYKYVTDAAIVTAIREELIKNNLIVVPDQLECTRDGEITTVKMSYAMIDVDSGETITSHVFGQGQDKGDKGIYKASTGAEKYYLLKTFLIPTSDDPEKDDKRSRVTEVTEPAAEVNKESHAVDFQTVVPMKIIPKTSKKTGKAYWVIEDIEGSKICIRQESVYRVFQDQMMAKGSVSALMEQTPYGPEAIEAYPVKI